MVGSRYGEGGTVVIHSLPIPAEMKCLTLTNFC